MGEFKQFNLKKKDGSKSPFQELNGQFYLTNDILSKNFVNQKRGFKLNQDGSIFSNAGNVTLYDAVIDVNGNGDYPGIQSALDAGKKRLFIRKGTYILTSDITIQSDTLLQGEDKYNTIIDCDGKTYQVKSTGDTPYETGTISVTKASATITGSGTTWSSNLAINDFIVFNQYFYKITSVNSDTEIEIETKYRGRTESSVSYKAGTFNDRIGINDLTVTNQGGLSVETGTINFVGVINSFIHNCIVTNNDSDFSRAISVSDSSHINLSNIKNSNNNQDGLYLSNVVNSEFTNIEANNNINHGIFLTGSEYNSFVNINANNNSFTGIGITSNNNNFTNIFANNNGSHGVHLSLSTAVNNNINIGTVDGNQLAGILSAGDFNTFTNINSNENTSLSFGFAGIYITGDYCTIANCTVKLNQKDGIVITGGSDNIISNCVVKDNGLLTNDTYSEIILKNTSTHNIINGNRVESSDSNKAKYGIREDSVNDDFNIVTSNIVTGAVTANISLQGANSVNANNI